MNLSVAINWDEELLHELSKYKCVSSVYASMDNNLCGTGRPSIVLPEVSNQQVEKIIKLANHYKFEFCYLLNGACLGNIEFNKDFHNKLLVYLDWLYDNGVNYIKVTIPYLLEFIKAKFPKLKVVVSAIAGVNSINSAKLWESMGADKITLDFNINRNFNLIKKIKDSVKCKIEILLNDACLLHCPYRNYHYNMNAHASQTKTLPYHTYCLLHCTLDRLENPTQVLMSPWIRPEDIKKYEKLGIDSYKISGRRHSTKWLIRAVKAYSEQIYNGNLSDILVSLIFGSNTDIDCSKSRDKESPEFQKYMANIDTLPPDRRILNEMPPFIGSIDNSKLSGFIDFFEEGKCNFLCDTCSYCSFWTNKVVDFDAYNCNIYTKMCKKFLSL